MLVAKPDLGIANSRIFAGFLTLNKLAGPPVGAALFALGLAWPFAGQLVCVLLGAVLVSRVRLPSHGQERHERTPRPGRHRGGAALAVAQPAGADAGPGDRHVQHHVRRRAGRAGALRTEHLEMGEVGFGLLTTASAIGGLIGTTSYGWLERHMPLGR